MLARLRWGQHGFANIRHANLSCPEQWQCRFSWRNKVSERWTGAWLHPLDYPDRSRVKVSLALLLCCHASHNPDHTSPISVLEPGARLETDAQLSAPHCGGCCMRAACYCYLPYLQEPADKVHWSYSDEARDAKAVAEAWDQAFLGALGPLPAVLHSSCCAEFTVQRENIRQRPSDFYVHLR